MLHIPPIASTFDSVTPIIYTEDYKFRFPEYAGFFLVLLLQFALLHFSFFLNSPFPSTNSVRSPSRPKINLHNHKTTTKHCIKPMAYQGIFSRGGGGYARNFFGGVQESQWRIEGRENGDLETVAP
jgi:hypothetical protein